MGVEVKAFKGSQDIINYEPNFVLSLAHQDPKLTPFPTYAVLTAPTRWYETPRFIRNILTYDGYLAVTPGTGEWLEDLTFGARKIDTPIGFYANTVSCLEGTASPNFESATLIYMGTNWDGNRHGTLFNELKGQSFMAFYGPEANWRGYDNSYKGSLPFDGTSVLQTLNDAGVGLCIEHRDFQIDGIPTNRIFETVASGAIAICSRSSFNQHWFGDNVLYINIDAPPAKVCAQIVAHIKWIRSNPEDAATMAKQAQAAYRKHLAPEKMLGNLFAYHEDSMTRKRYRTHEDTVETEPKVGVIMRAGGRGEKYLRRAIGSIAKQSHKNTTLYLILWDTPAGLDNVLADFPDLNVICKNQPGGGRSDCLWTGLRAAKDDACEFIGMLDDDDEYHVNMIASLLAGYNYHSKLSLTDPVTMITGGSLICFEAPVQHYFEDMTDEVHLPRPETHFIKQFHFPSRGQVSDRSFLASSNAMLICSKFLDLEVLKNPKLEIAEDYYLWLQLAERGRTAFVPEIVSTVHEHSEGQSNYRARSDKNRRQHQRIAKRMLGRQFFASEPYYADKTLANFPCDTLKATHVFMQDGPSDNDGLGEPVSLETLKNYNNIWLFGAGQFGLRMQQLLDVAGIPIIGVTDSFRAGKWCGYTLLAPNALSRQLEAKDAIIVASDYWRDISSQLRADDVTVDLFTVEDILFVQSQARISPIL